MHTCCDLRTSGADAQVACRVALLRACRAGSTLHSSALCQAGHSCWEVKRSLLPHVMSQTP